MADELNFLPEGTGGGIIEIAKQEALKNLSKIAKEALQEVDKTGVITSQLTEGDLIEIGTGIKEKDPDRVKNVINFNLKKIQSSIPEATLMALGINLGQPEMLAMNITNQLFQTGGAVVEGLAGLDLGDNMFSKGAEGMFDVANIIANNPQYGITPNLANIVGGVNQIYSDTAGRGLNWAGQKIYDFTNPLFNLLGSPFKSKEPKFRGMELPTVDPYIDQQPSVIDPYIESLNQPTTTQNNDGTQTISGGTNDPSDDITVTNLPTTSSSPQPAFSPQDMNIQPARPNPHFAQGGLASMARVLRR